MGWKYVLDIWTLYTIHTDIWLIVSMNYTCISDIESISGSNIFKLFYCVLQYALGSSIASLPRIDLLISCFFRFSA